MLGLIECSLSIDNLRSQAWHRQDAMISYSDRSAVSFVATGIKQLSGTTRNFIGTEAAEPMHSYIRSSWIAHTGAISLLHLNQYSLNKPSGRRSYLFSVELFRPEPPKAIPAIFPVSFTGYEPVCIMKFMIHDYEIASGHPDQIS